jgi:hypothetical protein
MMEYKEKRRFPRMKANCAMSFKRVASGSQAHALCVDISASGLMFEAEEAVELGRALEIRTFPGDRITPPITALVEVLRCAETEQGRYRIAGVIRGIKSQAPEPAPS